MLAGAMFQKPSVRLLTKGIACSRLSARTCVSGTGRQARQISQNLFLKCSFPGTKWGGHAPLLNPRPTRRNRHSRCRPTYACRKGDAALELCPVYTPRGASRRAVAKTDDVPSFHPGRLQLNTVSGLLQVALWTVFRVAGAVLSESRCS